MYSCFHLCTFLQLYPVLNDVKVCNNVFQGVKGQPKFVKDRQMDKQRCRGDDDDEVVSIFILAFLSRGHIKHSTKISCFDFTQDNTMLDSTFFSVWREFSYMRVEYNNYYRITVGTLYCVSC